MDVSWTAKASLPWQTLDLLRPLSRLRLATVPSIVKHLEESGLQTEL